MTTNKTIEHPGIVADIDGSVVKVKIEKETACASCHAKSACLASEMQDKIIEIHTSSSKNFSINEKVMVILRKSLGLKAAFLGYVLPLILVITGLLVFTKLDMDEIKAGLFALLILVPYFSLLYFLKDYLKGEFTFDIMTMNE